ncbi:hypothetical protein QYF36_021670 [Acer negundo]|nr:hypothetical protein QYF36_021670 [Acer negundo]
MGKKTTGKKGREKEKNKNKDLSTLREARHSENELRSSAENGAKLRDEVKAYKESRHEISGNGVDFEAYQSEEPLEVDDDVERKKKKKKKKRHETNGDFEAYQSEEPLEVDVDVKKKKKRHETSGDFEAFQSEEPLEVDVDVENKKKKKKKNRHETSGDDVELSACETEPLIKDNVDDDIIKQKKNEKRCEIGGNDIDLSYRQSEAVRESNVVEDKRKKKKLQEAGGSAVKHNTDQNDVLEGDVHVNKKEKSKDRHGVSVVKGQTKPKQGDIPELMNVEEVDQKKKKKKKRKRDKGVDFAEVEDATDAEAGKDRDQSDEKTMENVDNSKKKKKRQKNYSADVMVKNRTQKKSSKKVSFSDDVEVFPPPACLVHAKRFSEEENEMLKKAVLSYIEAHGFGEEGLEMVLNCRSHPETKNCWKEIAAALPWRPRESIYYRAHIIFERDENHKWSPEELELVKKFHEKHGSDWKTLASGLGKHRHHVKDAWRRIRFPNRKMGPWSQVEYQNLFDLVNSDLRMRASEEKKSKHGMLRDNISWEAISEKLSTRTNALCCQRWYDQLSSPLVKEGKWSDIDDYHMVNALSGLDACHIDDVDWDNLLEHRPGDICRKRWNQMVKHLGTYGSKPFAEQVEILSQRYCEDVLEAREAYNSRPAIDEA